MPCDIIISYQMVYDMEVSQSALALYDKLARRGRDVIWVEVTMTATAEGTNFLSELIMSTLGPGGLASVEMARKAQSASGAGGASAATAASAAAEAQPTAVAAESSAAARAISAQALFLEGTNDHIAHVGAHHAFRGANIYVIGHGGGGRAAGLTPGALSGSIESVLRDLLRVPHGTRFDMLALLACNVGKFPDAAAMAAAGAAAGTVAPTYPAELMTCFQRVNYRVDKIVAWNSWVTLYTFRHLANLCREHQAEFAEEIIKTVRLRIERMAPLKAAMAAGMFEEVASQLLGGVRLNQPLHASLALQLEAAMPMEIRALSDLVGKRLVESQRQYARPGQAAQLVKMKMFARPSPIAALNPRPAIDMTFDRPRYRELAIILSRVLVVEELVRLILSYEGMWIYCSDTRRVTFLDPSRASLVGLLAPNPAAPTAAGAAGAAAGGGAGGGSATALSAASASTSFF